MGKPHFLMVAAVAALSIALAPGMAGAQTSASDVSGSGSMSKAQRKEARKEARDQKNAELKKLEKNGYNPAAGNDSNYPNDIQNAEKKAASPGAASQ
ncbi:DUF4148 domain-containing protein [Paraburkholderia sp. J76]|uniref:DUF4148 domain-containing protein n=1 Tax=Paraburkholderia sp. J76 TaxID=2805439 RepID=UPI002ABE1DBA|nr:DUF4148 domain-containing protein [Paraburkholderia sp. J76]